MPDADEFCVVSAVITSLSRIGSETEPATAEPAKTTEIAAAERMDFMMTPSLNLW